LLISCLLFQVFISGSGRFFDEHKPLKNNQQPETRNKKHKSDPKNTPNFIPRHAARVGTAVASCPAAAPERH